MTDTTKSNPFDIDAILGELEEKPLTYKGEEFVLPAELPAIVLAPFLSDDLGLVDLITETLTEAGDEDEWDDLLVAALRKAPKLPKGLVLAVKDAFASLLGGPEQYDRFVSLNPSIQAIAAIARGIVLEYGVSLSDFFASAESSDTGGETSKPTSPASTPEAEKETSEASGPTPETPASSE